MEPQRKLVKLNYTIQGHSKKIKDWIIRSQVLSLLLKIKIECRSETKR